MAQTTQASGQMDAGLFAKLLATLQKEGLNLSFPNPEAKPADASALVADGTAKPNTGATAPIKPKAKPSSTPAQLPDVPQALTDHILNLNQVMPVVKVQSGLDGGKKQIGNAANALQSLSKIMQLFA